MTRRLPLATFLVAVSASLVFAQIQNPPPEKKEESAKAQKTEPAKSSEKKDRKSISLNKSMVLTYGSARWNQDSTKIDSATVIFRDANTKKAVLIIVDETAPDSAVFKGKYFISWTDVESMVPEVFIPPQNLVKEANWYKKFQAMVDSGQLKRRPFISRKSDNNERILDVFDTKEQAVSAMKAIEEQKKYAEDAKKAETPSPQMEKALAAAAAVLEAEKLAKLQAEALRLAQEAAAREAERARLAQLEAQKEEERKRKQAELNAAEKKKRKDEAAQLAAQALEHFKAGEFPQAEEKFRKAVELDPESTTYYYSYGVTLYRNSKFNDSLVALRRSPEGSYNPVERDFYLGLNHYSLKENGKALEYMRAAKAAKNPTLSPSAAFYEGLILFNENKYELARAPFQEVLDTSSDPRLDEQAESYLEQIARVLMFAAQKAKTVLLSATVGVQHDSNILLISDTQLDQGTATGSGGLRYLFTGSAHYRPVYETDKEFGVKATLTTLVSADSATFGGADPIVANFSFPYVYKSTIAGKGNKLEFTPAYETLNLDADGDDAGVKERLTNSIVAGINNTTVLDERRFSTINFNIRKDDAITIPESAAMKFALSTNQLRFIDKERKKMYNYEFGYTLNNAEGKFDENDQYVNDYYFTRYDVKVGYTQPAKWDTIWFSSLGLYIANYSKKETARNDKNYTLTTGLSKKLNDHFITGVTASYTTQDSSDDASTYNKWTAMMTLTSTYDF